MDNRRQVVGDILRACVIVMAVASVGGLYAVSRAEEEPADRASRSAAVKPASGKPTSAATDDAKLQRKLDDILANQQEILKKLDEQYAAVMEELRVVKIRATLRGGP